MTANDETTEPPGTIADTVRAFPAIAAVGLGVLYVTGAAARIGEIESAGLAPVDVLPLIPVEQLLARGVSTALPFFLALAAVDRIGRELTREKSRRLPKDWIGRGLVGAFFLLLAVTTFLAPLIVAIALPAGLLLGRVRRRRLLSGERGLLTVYAAGFGLLILGLYFIPSNLPTAEVDLKNRSHVVGPLIAFAHGNWHIARPKGDHSLLSLPQDEVMRIEIHRREKVNFGFSDSLPDLIRRFRR